MARTREARARARNKALGDLKTMNDYFRVTITVRPEDGSTDHSEEEIKEWVEVQFIGCDLGEVTVEHVEGRQDL